LPRILNIDYTLFPCQELGGGYVREAHEGSVGCDAQNQMVDGFQLVPGPSGRKVVDLTVEIFGDDV